MEERQFDKQITNHSHNHHQHHYYDSKSTSSSACFALMSLSAKRRAQCRPSPSRPAQHQFNASTWEEEEQSESMQLLTEDPACISSMQPSEHLLKENTIGKGSVDKSFTSDNVYMNTSKERNHIKRVLHKAHDTLEDKLVNNGNNNKVDTHTYEYSNKFNNTINKNKYSLSCSRARESPSSSSTLSSSLLLSNKLEWYRSSQSNQESSQLHQTYHCVNNKHENDSVHLNFARLFSSHQRLLSTTLTEKAKSSKRARQEVRDKESARINCFRNTKNTNNNTSSSRSESKGKGKRSSSRKSNFNVDNKISSGDKSHKYNICSGRNNSHTHNNTSSSNNKNKIKEENSSIKVTNKYNNYALQSARYIRTHSKLQDGPCIPTINDHSNYYSNNNSGKNSTKVHNYANADKVTEKHTHADIKHTTNDKEQCQKHNANLSTEEKMVEEQVKKESQETEYCISESHKCPHSKKTLLTSSSISQASLLPSSSPTTSLVETSLLPEVLVHILSEHSQPKQTKASVAVESHLCNNTERCHTNNERHQKNNHSVNEQKSKLRQTELSRSISKKRQNSKSADKRGETNKSSISTTTTTTTNSITNTKGNQIKSTMKTLVKPTAINVSKEQRRRELYA